MKLSIDSLFATVAPRLLADKAAADAKLLAKQQKDQEKAEIDFARKKLASTDAGGLTYIEREALRRKILEWETTEVFDPVCFVAVTQIDCCSTCFSETTHLVGVYQHQKKRSERQEKRIVVWAPEEPTDPRLPRQILTIHRLVHVCPRCLWEQGFVGEFRDPLGEVLQKVKP
jgi:hypothetical protein